MKRVVAAAALAMLALTASVAHAHKGKAVFQPVAANPYFVSDPNNPQVLLPAPGSLERGFGRDYVEMMARPRMPAGSAAEHDRLWPRERTKLAAPGEIAPNPYAATINGRVVVIEGSATTVKNIANGLTLDDQGLFEIANQIIGTLGDNYDFVTVFTTFPDADPNHAAFYLPLRNDIQGLGDCNPNTGETFGCEFDQTQGLKLQGLVFMNSLSTWQEWDAQFDGSTHPFDSFDSAVFSTLGQEVAHRWGSGLRFVDPRNGQVSKKLLGRDNSHWAAFVDTDASVMDGWDWGKPSSGKFPLLNDMDVYSTLDLYAMGALPVASAKPFFFIDGAKYSAPGTQFDGVAIGAADVLQSGLPSVAFMHANGVDVKATGQEVDLTIQDIVDAEGNRCPDPDHTQRTFRQAVALLTRPGQTAAQAQGDVDNLEIVLQTWEQWWSDRTGHALTLCTDLQADCKQALTTLGGGSVEIAGHTDQDFIERGDTVTVHVLVSATGDKVKGAHLAVSLEGGGAEHAKLDSTDIDVGDIDEGKDADVPVKFTVDGQYGCGSSLILVANIEADNAPTVREEYRLFPGYSTIFVQKFGGSDDFKVNADGKDGGSKGALVRDEIALSCDMTPRTPEKDNTPGTTGAYVTGVKDELDGDSSLWSPEIDLGGLAAPELAYDFWFEGDANDSLLVELSEDGKTFKKAVEETESAHGWGLNRVSIKDVFGHIPAKVTARFIFNGHGHLEGGIDNVLVIDPSGQCRTQIAGLFAGCGCSADGTAGPQTSALALAGLLGLRIVFRRRVRATRP